ncbi:MAG: tRNA 4-thiouridine(8) synthase ThiI [Spirochaetes bacterium]|nr:tRNA 4-thiouridine(8) synthase ThiI [Spirochaetota bacterium]
MNKRGILLYSGGLDSLLAGKVLLEQGIELIGYHFVLPFIAPDAELESLVPSKLAQQIGLQLKYIRLGKEYMALVENPPHGYGKQMNPCIDCKIYFLRYAAQSLQKENASFVATGEVIGQRPMSQMKHMMRHIEKESGLEGRILRPLCAKKLPPTEIEKSGIVDREKLLDISGRGRFRQMELAKKYGILEFQSPAGGCLFTDVHISKRVKDLFDFCPDYSMIDVYLLTIGRHFRLNPSAKCIIARNERENRELLKYQDCADYFFKPDFNGPCVFVRGRLSFEDQTLILASIVRYGTLREGNNVIVQLRPITKILSIPNTKITDEELKKFLV